MKSPTSIKQVKRSYDIIASHFSETRKYPWPEMKEAAQCIKKGMNILDVGCGNGRFIEAIPKNLDINYLGTDLSSEMIKCAKTRYPKNNFKQENLLDLNTTNKYDLIVSFAMFHHLSNEEERLEALNKIKNALKNDGIFIFTVWNLWSKKKIKFILKALINKILRKVKSYKDCLIPWYDKSGNKKTDRYYYAFRINELKKLLYKTGFKIELIELKPKDKKANIFVKTNVEK